MTNFYLFFYSIPQNTPYHQIFNSGYFKSSIKNAEISGFTEITMKIVLDYIRDFKEHDAARNNI